MARSAFLALKNAVVMAAQLVSDATPARLLDAYTASARSISPSRRNPWMTAV
jgi:hypothetical protein